MREQLLGAELISPDDLQLYQIASSPSHAVRIITRFYRNYHSSRFVKDLLVIRLKNAPPPSALPGLNDDFANIISGEKFQVVAATPQEREDDDCVALPRLAFGFDRRQYGRLRQLIDVLNSF